MSDDQQRRIAELEQEVAELRSRLGGEADGGAEHPEAETVEEPPRAGDGEAEVAPLPSRTRAIVVSLVIGIGALVGILAIVYALSTVIEPFSKRAASAIAPWEPPAKGAEAPPAKQQPSKATSEPLRAPGL
jgi:hypothetical protein